MFRRVRLFLPIPVLYARVQSLHCLTPKSMIFILGTKWLGALAKQAGLGNQHAVLFDHHSVLTACPSICEGLFGGEYGGAKTFRCSSSTRALCSSTRSCRGLSCEGVASHHQDHLVVLPLITRVACVDNREREKAAGTSGCIGTRRGRNKGHMRQQRPTSSSWPRRTDHESTAPDSRGCSVTDRTRGKMRQTQSGVDGFGFWPRC